jgi:hypothetical protein
MNLDLYNIFYLTFRLLPIILPSYFILSSIFSQDIKGLIYLAGLLIASVVAIGVGDSLREIGGVKELFETGADGDNTKLKCNLIALGGNSAVSQVPLSQAVFSYTFFYIIYIIGKHNDFKKNNLWIQNIPTVVFLGLIVIADFIWNLTNSCRSFFSILVSFLVAGTWGILWAWMIDSSGAVQLQYFNGLSNRTYCTRPSTQTFKCSNKR